MFISWFFLFDIISSTIENFFYWYTNSCILHWFWVKHIHQTMHCCQKLYYKIYNKYAEGFVGCILYLQRIQETASFLYILKVSLFVIKITVFLLLLCLLLIFLTLIFSQINFHFFCEVVDLVYFFLNISYYCFQIFLYFLRNYLTSFLSWWFSLCLFHRSTSLLFHYFFLFN